MILILFFVSRFDSFMVNYHGIILRMCKQSVAGLFSSSEASEEGYQSNESKYSATRLTRPTRPPEQPVKPEQLHIASAIRATSVTRATMHSNHAQQQYTTLLHTTCNVRMSIQWVSTFREAYREDACHLMISLLIAFQSFWHWFSMLL